MACLYTTGENVPAPSYLQYLELLFKNVNDLILCARSEFEALSRKQIMAKSGSLLLEKVQLSKSKVTCSAVTDRPASFTAFLTFERKCCGFFYIFLWGITVDWNRTMFLGGYPFLLLCDFVSLHYASLSLCTADGVFLCIYLIFSLAFAAEGRCGTKDCRWAMIYISSVNNYQFLRNWPACVAFDLFLSIGVRWNNKSWFSWSDDIRELSHSFPNYRDMNRFRCMFTRYMPCIFEDFTEQVNSLIILIRMTII